MADAISRHTSTCREILQECILIPRLAESEWAESRLADLNLWARGIGALAAGNSSLEKRLQNRKDIRDAVLNLLHVLQQQLGLCSKFLRLLVDLLPVCRRTSVHTLSLGELVQMYPIKA
jgi:hypothetical protein